MDEGINIPVFLKALRHFGYFKQASYVDLDVVETTSYGFENISFPFAVLMAGICFSLICVVCEVKSC